jgi:hypothetical protein
LEQLSFTKKWFRESIVERERDCKFTKKEEGPKLGNDASIYLCNSIRQFVRKPSWLYGHRRSLSTGGRFSFRFNKQLARGMEVRIVFVVGLKVGHELPVDGVGQVLLEVIPRSFASHPVSACATQTPEIILTDDLVSPGQRA